MTANRTGQPAGGKADELARLLDALEAVYDPKAQSEGRARIAAVYAGREADYLPIIVDCPAHDVIPQCDLHEQFYSAEAMLVEHLRRIVVAASVPDDGQLCIRANLGVVFLPSVFGLEPEVPHEVMPRFRQHLSKEDIRALTLPAEISRCEMVARAIDYIHYFQSVLGEKVHVYMPDTQGVFDIAHLLSGDSLFYELYDAPAFAHHLLELCLQAYLRVTLALKAVLGEALESGYHGHGMVSGLYMSQGGARVSEDTPTLLCPEHIEEFVVPYIVRALEAFGGGFVHYCGRNDHLFQALLELDQVRGINLGNPEKHEPREYVRALVDRDKFYFGSWPRMQGEPIEDYLRRMIDLTASRRKGLIFLLTPRQLGADSAEEAVHLWRRLQG